MTLSEAKKLILNGYSIVSNYEEDRKCLVDKNALSLCELNLTDEDLKDFLKHCEDLCNEFSTDDTFEFLNFITLIDLSDNKISDEGAVALAQSTIFKNIQWLNLNLNNITDEGVKYIAQSKNLKNLISLDLGNNHITNKGVKYIAQSKTLNNLKGFFFG